MVMRRRQIAMGSQYERCGGVKRQQRGAKGRREGVEGRRKNIKFDTKALVGNV